MSVPLLDPNLAALRRADPAAFLQGEQWEIRPAEHELDPVALELAVAFVAVCGLVAHFLADQDPRPGEVTVVAGQAWRNHAPAWLRMAVPAIRQAYALGRVQGLSEAELEAMATDYAVNLGDYLHESSGQALAEGFARQLDAKWSEGLAWRRAAAAYGLDRQQMRSYLSGVLARSEQAGKADPAPVAGRLVVEKLLVRRAERMGATESWRAMQAGRAIAWLLQAQTGQLPPGTLKEWDTRPGACAVCQALHEQRVPVTEPFVHPVSKVALWAPGAHPECRCGMRLGRPEAGGLEKLWREDRHPREHGRFSRAAGAAGIGAATLLAGRVGVRRFAVAAATRAAKPVQAEVYRRAYPHSTEILRMDRRQVRDHLGSLARGSDPVAQARHDEMFLGYTNNFQGRVRSPHPDDEAVRAYHHLIRHADPALTPEVHRGMHGVEHQVGDVVDFGPIASWTERRAIADNYAYSRAGTLAPRRYGGTYTVAAGRLRAIPVPRGTMHEHLGGGRFRVVGKRLDTTHDGHELHRYDLEPVEDREGRLAKACAAEPAAAGVCLLALDTGRVLMLQRAMDPADPAGGLWELPGGGLEPGEQPRHGAEREFAEEVHRRLPGDVRHIGSWIQGVYQGFVLTTATEAAVEPHRRGRVTNPDDPDGDAIEALAWWDPEQWARNPAVRPELRRALPALRVLLAQSRIGKARGKDPYDRDRRGRFAATEGRPAKPVRESGPAVTDPAVARILADLEQARQPFTQQPPFQALFQGRPFQGGQLFRAPDQDLFRRPGAPFGRGPSRFDRAKHPTGPGRRPDGRPHPHQRVIRHFLLEPRTEAHRHEPYYLPVEEFAAAYEEGADSQIWTRGDFVDFTDANEALRLNSSYFEEMNEPRSGLAAFRWQRPLPEMVDLDQPWTDGRETDERWVEVLPLARSLAQEAIDNADHILPALSVADLRAIHVMAGLDPDGQSEMAMRERILRTTRGHDGADDSLLGSYVDHMVWSESGMLGAAGSALSEILEQLLSEEVMIWGPERLQFFAFRDGFHQAPEPGRHTVDPDGDYVVDEVTYHSPLLEQGSGMRPWVLGWREVGLVPVDQDGRRLPVD